MATIEEAWKLQEHWSSDHDSACLLDLRARVEALEQRQAPEPAPAPAAYPPLLWEEMRDAYLNALPAIDAITYAAELEAVADWLTSREHCGAASALRTEARRAREGA